MGGTCEVNILVGYPSLINDEKVTNVIKAKMTEFLGADNVVDLPVRLTAEDFAYFSQKAPSCFYRLGTSNPNNDSKSFSIHHPRFDIDEEALKTGMGLMAWMAVN
jgi:amidohydrolase